MLAAVAVNLMGVLALFLTGAMSVQLGREFEVAPATIGRSRPCSHSARPSAARRWAGRCADSGAPQPVDRNRGLERGFADLRGESIGTHAGCRPAHRRAWQRHRSAGGQCTGGGQRSARSLRSRLRDQTVRDSAGHHAGRAGRAADRADRRVAVRLPAGCRGRTGGGVPDTRGSTADRSAQ